jgi:transposase
MPNRRKPMKKIREVIWMIKRHGFSCRKTAGALGISRPTVQEYLLKFERSGISVDEIDNMSDTALTELFENSDSHNTMVETARDKLYEEFPDYSKQLLKTGVNLKVLWEEYQKKHQEYYSYSRFCYHYGIWRESLEISMHQEYKAGDKLFVDFTGNKLSIVDRSTGTCIEKEVFVAILGASQYTYVEATESQKKEDFIRACENALHYFGGSPRAIVPDCLKSAITRGNKYEPEINQEFEDFTRHYGICPFPARPHEPRDKPLVEGAVKIAYSWIFAAIRDRIFYSLEELNMAIRELLEIYNSKKMQKLKVSRKELFFEMEKKELRPLPIERYEFKTFYQAKIQFNYHVHLRGDNHYYSVPYRYRGKIANIIVSNRTVEIFVDNIRIASHPRDRRQHVYTTNREHMPPNHQWVSDWNPERLINWGASIGINAEEMVKKILQNTSYPEQAYKVCLGILNLANVSGKERLDRACLRALQFNYYSLKGIKRILDKGLDRLDEEGTLFSAVSIHENIRGKEYFG